MRFEPAAAGGNEAVLTLDDDITSPGWGGYSTQQLDADLAGLKGSGVTRLVVRINSGGGEVQEAMAMYDAIRALKGVETVAEVRGYCCSAATLVALACEQVTMTPNSTFMVHEPKGGCYGTLRDWEAGMEHFRQLRSKVLGIYAAKTGLSPEEVEKQMLATTWLTAQQALAGGWIDAVSGEATPAEEPAEEKPGAEEPAEEPAEAPSVPEPEAKKERRGLMGWGALKNLLGRGKLLGGSDAGGECGGDADAAQMRAEVLACRRSAAQARQDLKAERAMREEMISCEVARRLTASGALRTLPPALPEQGSPGCPIHSAAEGWLARIKAV